MLYIYMTGFPVCFTFVSLEQNCSISSVKNNRETERVTNWSMHPRNNIRVAVRFYGQTMDSSFKVICSKLEPLSFSLYSSLFLSYSLFRSDYKTEFITPFLLSMNED